MNQVALVGTCHYRWSDRSTKSRTRPTSSPTLIERNGSGRCTREIHSARRANYGRVVVPIESPFIQEGFDRRFDWGLEGASRLAHVVDLLIVVDVLSFSTAVDVVVSRGATVIPIAWRDSRAADFAREIDAHLAVGRSHMSPRTPSR